MLARKLTSFFGSLAVVCGSLVPSYGQESPPAPSAPRSVKIPAVQTAKLPNGLKIAVVQRRGVPLVAVNLLIDVGAYVEEPDEAGIANMTASLLTKGTKTRTATEIAEAIEFLGADLNAGAGWNATNISLNVTSDKLAAAFAIFADVVRSPKFEQSELDLARSQALDGLTYNLKQPSFLSNYVATKYAFGEHPAGGTPDTLAKMTAASVRKFYDESYLPDRSTMIFAGDIDLVKAKALASRYFATWKPSARKELIQSIITNAAPKSKPAEPKTPAGILVIDLPNSGQASVSYTKKMPNGRVDDAKGKPQADPGYYQAMVLNSVLGGGYSSRLNAEIRIKRGLSYGAGSGFGWRYGDSNFATRAQTKNESAPEVASLVIDEIRKLTASSVDNDELVPRKSVLTGGFGRSLETINGLASAVSDLYAFGLPASELNSYIGRVNSVTDAQIRSFAADHLLGGSIIIVGDYAVFKKDLAARFPGVKIDVIKAADLDLSKDDLRK